MIKILYIQPYASQVGGVDSVLLQLIEGLDRTRYEPFVMLTAPTAYSERYERLGCRVLYGPVAVFGKPTDAGYYFRNIHTLFRSVATVRRMVREHGIGLIHSHKMEAFGGNIAGKWMGVPTVQTVHEIPRRPLFAYKLIAWLNHLFNDKVVVLCEPSRRMFRWLGRDFGKVVKIYNGIEPSSTSTTMTLSSTGSADMPLKLQLGLASEDKLFLTVARLTPMKGLDDLVDAAERLSKTHPHLKFAIAGDVAFEHELPYKSSLIARIRERGLEQTVFLLGLRRDVPRLLVQVDALVLPSAYDIFPTVVLEAMNAGLPVVATSVGGVPEMVRPETGILVPPRSGSELAEGIVQLMELDYQAMGQSARELFLREFTRRRYVEETERVYEEVLGRYPVATAEVATART